MKVIFKNLIIDNFLSFGHAELDLQNKGFTLIQGINNNPKDSANSNGSGKSTIFSALCYALTGETIQGISSNLRNMFIPNEDMKVELSFEVDGKEFKVIRSRDTRDKGNLKVFINGEDKSGKGLKESENILRQNLPALTSSLIGEVIIVGQGMPHKFSSNTPSGRKDLLEQLSNSDVMLMDIRNRVDSRYSELKDKKTKFENKLIELNTTKSITEGNIAKKEQELEGYKNKPDFDDDIVKINNKLKEYNSQLKFNIDSKNKLNITLTNLNKDYNDIVSNEQEEKNNELKAFSNANISVKTQIAQLSAQIASLNRDIRDKQNIKDVCPLCGQKIPHVHKPNITSLLEERKQLDESLSKLNEKDRNQNQAYSLNIQDIENEYKERKNNFIQEINKNKTALNDIEEKIDRINLEINNANILLSETKKNREFFEQNLNKCKQDLEENKSQLTKINNDILYNIQEKDKIQEHIDIVSKMITYVKRDFRGILLTNVIKYIDGKSKEYSQEIFGTRDLNFALNGNNIETTYLGKQLESLSGGEQQKVDLITQFAIRSMMQEYTGFSSNILVLDEILDNLDTIGCDKVLNFVSTKLSDIESIFIISHHVDTLNIGNDSTIIVTKNKEGISSLYEK